jgi:uncharacterized protein
METFDVVRANLLSPMVLAFALGVLATLVRSDLKFPTELYTALTIYLLLAIGLKGGAELAQTPFVAFLRPAVLALLLAFAIPLWSYAILRRLGGFKSADAAALAAHYGSVSAVTFIASQTFLQSLGVPFEGFMPTLLAILEIPAIMIALTLARLSREAGPRGSWSTLLHEVFAGRSVFLLLGGLVIGYLSGPQGLNQVAPLFVDPFRGVLALFLLEMGMVAARRFGDLRKVGGFLLGFGLVMPVVHGVLGVVAGYLAGLTPGGSTMLGVLMASASYIAAPAAVRIALPQANPSYYLTASLAITFPFNLTVGIPLYYAIAQRIHASP